MAKKNKSVQEEKLEQETGPEEEELENEEELEEDENEEDQVEEETDAAASLHPGSKPLDDPKSKLDVMKAVIGAVAAAEGPDLGYWEKALAAVPHDGAGVGDVAASNKASIDTKPSDAVREAVREDLQVLFDADKTLTEEARERLQTIFEAAVTARVIIEREEMEEQYEDSVNETIEEVKTEIEEQLGSYLSYCTDNWMEENQVAVESTIKSELTEEFMEGLRQLFAEHFIDIPDNKSDVVEALTEKVAELEEALNAVIEENNELTGRNIEAALENAIDEVATGLTVSQTEKLAKLSEDVEFDGNIDAFMKKVGVIRETYFGANGSKPTEKLEDDFEKTGDALNEETTKEITDPIMKRYAAKISQTMKEDLLVK